MKIAQFKTPGAPSVLEYMDVPIPPLKDGEVLVKAQAIGVGMPDILIRQGKYNWMPPLPAAPGTEMSGTIEQVGPGTTLKVGQRVVVSAREREHRGGCYAEYNATPESSVYALPDSADMEEAAALANYQVAFHLLYDCVSFKKGQSVLVYGAAGGCGSALVDLARGAGLEVIGICSGAEKAAFVKSLGAAHVIDRSAGNLFDVINMTLGRKGVDVVFDCIGGRDFTRNFELLGRYGTLVSYGQLDGPVEGDVFAAMRKQTAKNLALRTFTMHIFDHWPEHRKEGMRWLIERLGTHEIKPRIHGHLPLAQARQAHELFESGAVMGKLLLKP